MSRISQMELYEYLDVGLGKETAKKLTSFIADEINDKIEHNMKTLATKEDLAKLDNKINETKVGIIKWIFAFWITVILMFIGLYFKS